jgi:hypothetical protein
MSKKKQQRPLRYVGDGSAWVWETKPPISRDLEADEVDEYGGEKVLLASGLYEVKNGDKQ